MHPGPGAITPCLLYTSDAADEGLGVYFLPILTAPESVEISKINEYENKSKYQTEFVRDLRGSDPFHWGEAKVTISNTKITVNGAIAPGPDYKLYLTNEFTQHEDCLLYTSPSPRDLSTSRMPSSA